MGKVLIIGAGGVGGVVTHKCAQVPEVFEDICLASRTAEKCEKIAAQLDRPIRTEKVDADNVAETLYVRRNAEFVNKHYNDAYPMLSLLEDQLSSA